MTHDLILKNIAKHIVLDNEEINYFTAHLTLKEIPKKTCLLSEGQACKYLSYVHSGALRSYCLDKEGKQSTIMFAVADWWLTDMYCFLNERPAMMFIETIEDSSVFQLSRENFGKLFNAIPKFERFFRILMQNAYIREQLRVIQNLSMPAEERYLNFLKKYPQLVQRVTQKQIASYIGVSPEFLSAMRKRMLKK